MMALGGRQEVTYVLVSWGRSNYPQGTSRMFGPEATKPQSSYQLLSGFLPAEKERVSLKGLFLQKYFSRNIHVQQHLIHWITLNQCISMVHPFQKNRVSLPVRTRWNTISS